MSTTDALRQKLDAGRFCHMVELVASARTTEEKLLDICSSLAGLDMIDAAGITSYAGGASGHDPVRTSIGAMERGLTPNIHLTCVYRDRRGIRQTLEELHRLDIHNIFAITGDYPRDNKDAAVFDLDSVALVSMIDEMREAGMPFRISVAVSPFKYTEPDCLYQYIKLEKKLAAGADFAITQLGYDVRKFRELKRYLDDKGIAKPVIGNVYVLGKRAAEIMSEGRPPGGLPLNCWSALPKRPERRTRARRRGWNARRGRWLFCADWDTPAPISGELTTRSRFSGSFAAVKNWRRGGKSMPRN